MVPQTTTKMNAEEFLKKHYPTTVEWLNEPDAICGMYETILDALEQYARQDAQDRYEKAIDYWNNSVVPRIPNRPDAIPPPGAILKVIVIAAGGKE